jgi:hypothetical protein
LKSRRWWRWNPDGWWPAIERARTRTRTLMRVFTPDLNQINLVDE